ncbi:MAG: SDR family NAD(P)-dependent oxidoreductase [Christensenellaceae bacterium]
MSKFELQNKNIVITGASSGIGYGLLQELSKINGTKIVAAARNCDSIKKENLSNVTCVEYDLSSQTNIDNMLHDAIEILGSIDIFFANAGFAYYEKMQTADWAHIQNIFDLNVFSPIYTLQKLNDLLPQASIKYVVTDSALAKAALPGFALYSATKFAVDGFVQAYEYECPKNIHITTIYPVATKTNFFKRAADAAPLPFPTQTTQQVVHAILKGLHKKRIYPLAAFGFLNWLWSAFPFLKSGYLKLENNKFQKWLNK